MVEWLWRSCEIPVRKNVREGTNANGHEESARSIRRLTRSVFGIASPAESQALGGADGRLGLTVGTHTISHVILRAEAHESEHSASLYRFLSRAKWESDRVAAKIFLLMVKALLSSVSKLIPVIDDTLRSHVGRKICGAALSA